MCQASHPKSPAREEPRQDSNTDLPASQTGFSPLQGLAYPLGLHEGWEQGLGRSLRGRGRNKAQRVFIRIQRGRDSGRRLEILICRTGAMIPVLLSIQVLSDGLPRGRPLFCQGPGGEYSLSRPLHTAVAGGRRLQRVCKRTGHGVCQPNFTYKNRLQGRCGQRGTVCQALGSGRPSKALGA